MTKLHMFMLSLLLICVGIFGFVCGRKWQLSEEIADIKATTQKIKDSQSKVFREPNYIDPHGMIYGDHGHFNHDSSEECIQENGKECIIEDHPDGTRSSWCSETCDRAKELYKQRYDDGR